VKQFKVVGKPLPRLNGIDRVIGRATYTVAVAPPGLLHARLFRSPVPHAKIRRLDVSRDERFLALAPFSPRTMRRANDSVSEVRTRSSLRAIKRVTWAT